MSILQDAEKNANSIKSILLVLTTLFAVVGTIVGGYGFLDSKFAHAEEVEKLEKRVTLAELKTSLRTALEEMYFLRDQSRKYPDDEEIKERLKEASSLVDDIKEQIKKQTNEHNPQNP